MIGTIIGLVFSKIGIYVAGAVGFLAVLLYGKYYKNKAQRLEQENVGYQARIELEEELEVVENETKERVEKADTLDADQLADAFSKLCSESDD